MDKINRELTLASPNGVVSNAEVLTRFKESNGADIAHLTPRLVDIALTKLLNDVSGRKKRSTTAGGLDLFGEYHNIPQSVRFAKNVKKILLC
jgi:hypothetical protein